MVDTLMSVLTPVGWVGQVGHDKKGALWSHVHVLLEFFLYVMIGLICAQD